MSDIYLVSRGTHGEGWESFFEELQFDLRKLLGDQSHPVQWFGSTSIDSVGYAKPILDIAVAEDHNSMRVAKFLDKRFKDTGKKRLENSIRRYS